MDRGLRSQLPFYDDYKFIKPTLYIICGIPASGKSTKAIELSKQYNANIHSSDAIRAELGDINSQDKNNEVFRILHSRIFTDLKNGKNVIYDATNLKLKTRLAFLTELKQHKINCHKVCVLMATPYEDCLINNQNRDRKVPEEVIKRMYKSFEMPSIYEGFDKLKIYCNRKKYPEYDFNKKLDYLKSISHDNPHHSLSIGEHCIACNEQMEHMVYDGNFNFCNYHKRTELLTASLLHDISKDKVKEFKNVHGEITEYAHYYQHHCVSAYDSLFYLTHLILSINEYVNIILLINYHMKPFEWEYSDNPDKSIKKFKSVYGEELYSDIMLLHECDLKAH